MMMKFELLPNEIFIEIFEYLSIFDIFYSFNYLNNHINKLIRSIPLHLNFKNIQKSTFDQFCQLLLTNSEIQNQVSTLILSNKEIEIFLSKFSLEQFINLHSLTLIQVEDNILQKLIYILPFISQLYSFHLIDSNDINLIYPLTSNLEMLSITNLTISACSFDQLFNPLFKYLPILKSLTIYYLSQSYSWEENYSNLITYNAVHLKELIIFNFEYKFEDFQILAKHLPKLINLKICGTVDLDMINANQWKDLIVSSLSNLKNFKFIFNYINKINDDYNDILEKFNQFQTDFWILKHWYIEYELSYYSASIYTVPYLLNSYKLEIDTQRYWNQFVNTFNRVTNLTLYNITLKENTCQYYFPNVRSLTILPPDNTRRPALGIRTIQSLKNVINPSILKHLNISFKFQIRESSSLLNMLKEFPQLISLTINIRALEQFGHNKDLCEYLNKTIKILDIYKHHSSSFKYPYQLEEFCKIFSNIQQLRCNISQTKDLLYLLNYLPKLFNLKAYLWKINDYDYFYSWFKQKTRHLNLLFNMKYIDKYETELSIWINRNI